MITLHFYLLSPYSERLCSPYVNRCKTLYSPCASIHPGVLMGNDEFYAGGTLRWARALLQGE